MRKTVQTWPKIKTPVKGSLSHKSHKVFWEIHFKNSEFWYHHSDYLRTDCPTGLFLTTKICRQDSLFPGLTHGPGVKNLSANAGNTSSILGPRTKTPQAAGQRSPCAATTEPMHPRAHGLQREKPPEQEACMLQLEKARVQHRRPSTAKHKKLSRQRNKQKF